MHQLAFAIAHSYARRDASITVPVVLRSGSRFVDLVASLDTGAAHCLFENAYAAELGLDLTSGALMRFRTSQYELSTRTGTRLKLTCWGLSLIRWSFSSQSRQSGRTS